jgi:hypothetical protein
MNETYLRSDPELDRKLAECNDPEAIREIVKAHLAAQGIIRRERGNDFGARIVGQQQTPEAPLAASGYKFEREFRFHPASGRRTLMLRANTLEDLNELQAQIEKTI